MAVRWMGNTLYLTGEDAAEFQRAVSEPPNPNAVEAMRRGLKMAEEFSKHGFCTMKVMKPNSDN